MALRELIRVDLKQATDNGDGTISARAFPLTIWPRGDQQMTAFMIDQIQISPNNSVLELQFTLPSGDTQIYNTATGGWAFVGQVVQYMPLMVTMYNLNPTSGVTVMFAVTSYRYDEPLFPSGQGGPYAVVM